jgi:hypothetical protein
VEVPVASTVASSTASAQPIQPLSPDTLLFARTNGDLVLYDLNLGQEQLLIPGRYGPGNSEFQWFAAVDTPVRLSPDGRWLLVPTADQGTWLVAVDGSTQRQLSPERLSATWAPDSRRIVFSSQQGPVERPQDKELYVQDVVGGDAPRLLARLPDPVAYPTWSPGCDSAVQDEKRSCGRHVFTISSCGDQPDGYTCAVWLIDVENGQTKVLGQYAPPASEVSPTNFVWSPQEDEIWVTAANGWMAFPLDGSSPHPLPAVMATACAPRVLEQHQTGGGWTVEWQSWAPNLKATSPAGVTQVIAEAVYFLGTWEELQRKSTEVCTGTSVDAGSS